MPKLAIVISTYRRPDGKTPFYLNRTLDYIDAQTFGDYHVYVVGDAYDDAFELHTIIKNHKNVTADNLTVSPERERYGFGNMKIWCAGGVTAVNRGIDLALADGYEYICHQSHDDVWDIYHLAEINSIIEQYNPIFCCTLSTYGKHILPPYPEDGNIIEYYPIDGGLIAQSTCVRYSHTKLRPIDRFFTEGIVSPCDAYLWEQLRNEMKATGQKGYLKCRITCHHDEEGYAMNTNQVEKHARVSKRHR